ncbi:MAG TPA: hypothetical protein VMA13_12415 [Candidatus Saccharimonadales bacterium]|nr:hypothetical protein [Candidatus Saccharimonadales bacterium]
MNDTLQEWLATGAIATGMMGCGMRLPDSTCLSYSFNEMCPREHLDQILHQFAGAMTLLTGHGLAPNRLVWTFDQGQIFMITRPDGALLILVIQPNTDAAENVDQLAEEFLSLEAVS